MFTKGSFRRAMGNFGKMGYSAFDMAYKNKYFRRMSAGAVLGGMYGMADNIYGRDKVGVLEGMAYGAGAVGGAHLLGAAGRRELRSAASRIFRRGR
jgi:hypothetical protein